MRGMVFHVHEWLESYIGPVALVMQLYNQKGRNGSAKREIYIICIFVLHNKLKSNQLKTRFSLIWQVNFQIIKNILDNLPRMV